MRKEGNQGCQMKAEMKALVTKVEVDHFIAPERNQAANRTNVNRSNRCSNLFMLKISSQ